jgi:hypothetical protein
VGQVAHLRFTGDNLRAASADGQAQPR